MPRHGGRGERKRQQSLPSRSTDNTPALRADRTQDTEARDKGRGDHIPPLSSAVAAREACPHSALSSNSLPGGPQLQEPQMRVTIPLHFFSRASSSVQLIDGNRHRIYQYR